MKWNLISLVSLAALFTACTDNEVIDVKQEPITFSVSTENVTRAKSISDGSNLTKFALYADYKASDDDTPSIYLSADTLRGNATSWSVDGGNIYWPNDGGTLDFYAIANNDANSYAFNATTRVRTVKHSVNKDVDKQTDLLYAVKTGESKPGNTNNSVVLNFRHALAQIAFQAKCLNSHLKVTISEVKLANVKDAATFTLPTSSTTNSTDGASDDTSRWELSSTAEPVSYAISDLSKVLKGKSETVVDLSKKTVDSKDVVDNYMLLIPQNVTKWDPTQATISKTTGSYLALKCKIENYGSSDVTSSVCFWPTGSDKSEDYVYIPVDFNWSAGHKYVYTFVFGATTKGGYDENGAEVLTPITYDVTVSSFTSTDTTVDVQ